MSKKERLINAGHLQWKGNEGKITTEARTLAELSRNCTYLLVRWRRRTKSPIRNYKKRNTKRINWVSLDQIFSWFNFHHPFMYNLPTCNTKMSSAKRRLLMFLLGAARFHLRLNTFFLFLNCYTIHTNVCEGFFFAIGSLRSLMPLVTICPSIC